MKRWLAGKFFLGAPLESIIGSIRRFGEGHFSERIEPVREGELAELASAFNGMADRLQKTMEQIGQQKEEAQAILSSMVEAVVAVDHKGLILFLNPAAESLFGRSNVQAIGRPYVEAIRHASLSELLNRVVETQESVSESIRLFFPEERFFEARAVPLRKGTSRGAALLVLHDTTRIQKLEQIRRDFVANVSHELRTPLTSIQGFAETLLSGALQDPKHNREFVQTIFDQANRLRRLVDDLLDLSAVESGRKAPQRQPVSIQELAREVRLMMEPLGKKSQVSIRVEIPVDFPPVPADRDQLKQVLVNLVDNAIKFNRANGSVEISASSNQKSSILAVKDTGSGIPESDLPRIFERFYRTDKARSRELGGTGLGLAIVKHIVEAHGGAVRVESSPGKGSAFFIEIPL